MTDFLTLFDNMPIWMKLGRVVGVSRTVLDPGRLLFPYIYKLQKGSTHGSQLVFFLLSMLINVGFGALTYSHPFNNAIKTKSSK